MDKFPKFPLPPTDMVEISRVSYDRYIERIPFEIFQMVKARELEIYLQNNKNVDWQIVWGRGDLHFSVELYIR